MAMFDSYTPMDIRMWLFRLLTCGMVLSVMNKEECIYDTFGQP